MKNSIACICALFMALYAKAQFEVNDTVHHIKITAYVGVLAGPQVYVSPKVTTRGFYYFRAGGSVLWQPKPWVSLFALGAGELDQTGKVTPFNLAAVNLYPSKRTLLSLGKIATPMTELRPIPTTGAGQFEPWTRAQMPGSAIGGKFAYTYKPGGYYVVIGGFWRDSVVSAELGMGFPYVRIAGYYMSNIKRFGAGMEIKYKIWTQVFTYNYRGNIGSLTYLLIPKTKGLAIYSDAGINTQNWKLMRGEWGLVKEYELKFIKNITISGLFGAGYSQETKSVKAYLFMHI